MGVEDMQLAHQQYIAILKRESERIIERHKTLIQNILSKDMAQSIEQTFNWALKKLWEIPEKILLELKKVQHEFGNNNKFYQMRIKSLKQQMNIYIWVVDLDKNIIQQAWRTGEIDVSEILESIDTYAATIRQETLRLFWE